VSYKFQEKGKVNKPAPGIAAGAATGPGNQEQARTGPGTGMAAQVEGAAPRGTCGGSCGIALREIRTRVG